MANPGPNTWHCTATSGCHESSETFTERKGGPELMDGREMRTTPFQASRWRVVFTPWATSSAHSSIKLGNPTSEVQGQGLGLDTKDGKSHDN